MATTYKRVLLKLSGEALKSGSELFDFPMVQHVAPIARHARKLFRRVPIALGKAVVGYGARSDDIAAVHAAALGDQRDDL